MGQPKIEDVELENGETGQIETCKSYEDGHDYYRPLDEDGNGCGEAFSSKEDAIEHLNDKN